MPKYKEGPSWGEVADFEDAIRQIQRSAMQIAKESKTYMNQGGSMSDGDICTSNIKGDMLIIQNRMKKINAYCRKYRNL